MSTPGPFPDHRVPLAALALFALLVCAYTWSVDLRATRGASITGDEPFYLLTTQSLLQDGDLDLRNQYEWQAYRAFFDHEQPLWLQSAQRPGEPLLSPHEPGLAVYLVPGFALGGLRGAQVQLLITAALTYALAFLLVARAAPKPTSAPLLAWLATAAVALTAPAFVYATEVYPEGPAALCLVLALLLLAQPRGGLASAVALALLVTALAWLGTKYVPLGIVVGLASVWRLDPRARGVFVALSALSGAAYLAWHLATFGALTAYSASWAWDGAPSTEVLRDHLATTSLGERAYRLTGIFVDQRFGLGRWAPLLLLVPAALPLLAHRGGLARIALALLAVQLLLATFVALTMMGWWFPGRTMIAVLPLAAWVLTELLVRAASWGRVAIGALAGYSLAVTLTLVAASRAREVHIALDPFELSAWLFRVPAPLFPDYRVWDAHTVLLHALWTAAAILGAVACARRTRGRAVASAVRGYPTETGPQREDRASAGVTA